MEATREWWEDFFHGPWGRLQAEGFGQKRTSEETDLIVSVLGLEPEDRVLDLACGTGRHSIALAERGFDVTGVDFNGNALAIAGKAASERGVAPRFVELDMRAIDWAHAFDAVISFWSSFGYFEHEADDLEVARRVSTALRPGGRFLLDLTISETLAPIYQPYRWEWLDDERTRRLLQETRWNFETGRVDADWTFIDPDRTHTARSSLRLYGHRELCDLLREAGFRRFESYDSLSGKPFRIGSRRLSLVASRE